MARTPLSGPAGAAAPGRPEAPGRRLRTWFVALVATVISACTLDVVASVTGTVLATSSFLDDSADAVLMGALAASYLLWAAGLRASIVANWLMLERVGVSTNVLSKALFEVARRRWTVRRAPRAASAVGYALTELVKEAPYYVGAFGAAVLSDAVDSTDAVVFLIGTNIGAAAYEYGLARVSRIYLVRRSASIG